LRKAGLRTIHMGIESGSNKVLKILNKEVNAEQIIEGSLKAIEADFKLTTHVILGAGGRLEWREHSIKTGELLTKINPHAIIMLTLVIVPHTPLFEKARRGSFTPPTPVESILELKQLITGLNLTNTTFKSEHSSNYLKVSGKLPENKEEMLHKLERVLNNPTEDFFSPDYFRGF